MKYKVTLNGRTYEVEVEAGKAMLMDEYEAYAPAAPAPAAAAPVAAAPSPLPLPLLPRLPVQPCAAGEAVTRPMPGNILKVNVTAGSGRERGRRADASWRP